MRKCFLFLVAALFVFAFITPGFAQVAQRTGSIFGKVVDDKGAPLPGVNINMESNVGRGQTAVSGPNGTFRFANLPPGQYSCTFSIEGFTEVRQEDIRVSVGGEVQLEITLKPALAEEFVVVAETPVIDTKKTGNSDNFNREYMNQVPSGRNPWTILDQTSGVDADRYDVAGSEGGSQAQFVARGSSNDAVIWNYDGINSTDPAALGGSPTYYDFEAFEEINIVTGATDASVGTSGVTVNLVTKRGGNKWEANANYYYVSEGMQSENTPSGLPASKSIHIDQIKDYGFDVGGPIVKDRLFVWGAFRKNDIGIFTVAGNRDLTNLKDKNFKANVNESSSHESQFGYFDGEKVKSNRAAIDAASQDVETLWQQGGPTGILKGIWSGQHTWIPNDHTIVTGRYGYIGLGFSLQSNAPETDPSILLAAIPRWESNLFSFDPIQRPSHDVSADVNYFKENWAGGDHEFKFGFEYKHSKVHTTTTIGNGLYFVDSGQTTPHGPLTYGYAYIYHNPAADGAFNTDFTSAFVNDTIRSGKMTLNLGLRYDNQHGKNLAGTLPAPAGFESLLGPIDFAGNDPGVSFNTFSPRLGVTYDLSGDGKTILRGNFARYYGGFNPATIMNYSNPAFTVTGLNAQYVNANGDRNITLDEIDPSTITYFGGLDANGNFDVNTFNSLRQYASDLHPDWSNEVIAGVEREVAKNMVVAATWTYRKYGDFYTNLPLGITSADFVQVGTFTAHTTLGDFSEPEFALNAAAADAASDGAQITRNIDGYTQTYSGLDLNLRKRMSDNFMLNGSFVLQRQRGHYNGPDSLMYTIADGGITGIQFPGDPSNSKYLDDESYAYAPGGSGKSGVFPFAEWQFKLSGVYQFPYQITVGGAMRYQQGYPSPLFGDFSDTSYAATYGTTHHLILLEPFGSRRYDNLFTLDLRFEKAFDISSYGRLAVQADVFNVTNANTTIQQQRLATSRSLGGITEYLSPRALRLGVRYSF